MIFDKNQKDFPSETHKKIWEAGIHIPGVSQRSVQTIFETV